MPKRNGKGIELLADPTRRRMIQLMALRPRRPSALAREMGLSRPAISRQLRLLREAALIRPISALHDGRGILYAIEPANHGRITAWLAGTEMGLDPEQLRLRPPRIRLRPPPGPGEEDVRWDLSEHE